jgi:hypothetical protein
MSFVARAFAYASSGIIFSEPNDPSLVLTPLCSCCLERHLHLFMYSILCFKLYIPVYLGERFYTCNPVYLDG